MVASCECPNPPGGSGKCGNSQLAICRSENGKCNTKCVDIPHKVLSHLRSSTGNKRIVNRWVMLEVGVDTNLGLTENYKTAAPASRYSAGKKRVVKKKAAGNRKVTPGNYKFKEKIVEEKNGVVSTTTISLPRLKQK